MADDPEIPTLFGWDASDYDWARGPMDLGAARRDGIDFFTHKATEGVTTRHRNYGEALRRARDAGIPVLGAYHVVRTAPSIASQVAYFVSYLDSQTPWWRSWPDFFVQVDLELWSYDKVPANAGEAFADAVEAATGRRAVIYASRGQYGSQLAGTSHPLWNANYGSNAEGHYRAVYAARGGDSGAGWVAYSGKMPIIWQYGSRTTIGTQTICDANAFRGTLAELKALLKGDDMSWDAVIGDKTTNPNSASAGALLVGANIAAFDTLNLLKATSAEDATRHAATLAAVKALAEAGGVDAAPIVEAIKAEAAATRALVERQHAEEIALLRREHEAELAAARAEVTARTGS